MCNPCRCKLDLLFNLDLSRNLGVDLGLFLLWGEVRFVPVLALLPRDIDPTILGVPFDDDRLGHVVQQPIDRFEPAGEVSSIRGRCERRTG